MVELEYLASSAELQAQVPPPSRAAYTPGKSGESPWPRTAAGVTGAVGEPQGSPCPQHAGRAARVVCLGRPTWSWAPTGSNRSANPDLFLLPVLWKFLHGTRLRPTLPGGRWVGGHRRGEDTAAAAEALLGLNFLLFLPNQRMNCKSLSPLRRRRLSLRLRSSARALVPGPPGPHRPPPSSPRCFCGEARGPGQFSPCLLPLLLRGLWHRTLQLVRALLVQRGRPGLSCVCPALRPPHLLSGRLR